MSQYYTINHARNPRWANPEHNAIDLEVDFSDLPEEYLPYTASPTDVVEHSRELYSRALDGEFGEIAEFVPALKWTPINKTTIEVSTEGLVQLLLEKGILTDEEVDTILIEETVTVGFARTTTDGSNPVYNGIF
jgi:hypothetical protein